MEINNTTIITYYSSRLFGFAPYTLTRDKYNQVRDVKFSRFLCAYSVITVTAFSLLTNYGLYYDTHSVYPIRMKTPTSKVVTGFDVNVVVSSCFIGMLTSVFGLQNAQLMNYRLRKADGVLAILCKKATMHELSDKRKTILLVAIIYLWIGSMLLLDIYGWIGIATKLKNRDSNAVSIDNNLFCFMPFYGMYIFLMALHIKFAQSAHRIGQRYRTLNEALKQSLTHDSIASLYRSTPSIGIPYKRNFIAAINHGTGRSEGGGGHVNSIRTNYSKIYTSFPNPDDIINQFADAHETLGKAMVNVSEEFGITIIILLISCLLHLVATAYFFFLELLGEKDTFFTTVQMLWIIFHVGRLLLIVEPCHIVATEAERTIMIVCELMRTKRELYSLRNFWQQLLADKSYFSACGMCRIDRQLLTSISGAIATYLVILLQFQKSNG